MKRGFLNKSKALESSKPPKVTAASSASCPEPTKLKVDHLIYGKVADEHKLTEKEEKELVEKRPFYQGCNGAKTDYPDGQFVISSIPPDVKGQPPNPDGHSIWIVNGPTKAKILNLPGYPARTPKPRIPGMCEVRDAPGMGKGLFATCNISRGELVLSERPLIVIPRAIPIDITSTVPQGLSREKIHQLAILRFEVHVEVASKLMRDDKLAAFLALMNCHKEDGIGPLFGICRTNGFELDIKDDSTGMTYSATGDLASRINHSCIPNVTQTFKKSSFSLQLYATKDIKAGEEFFIAYNPIYNSKSERQKELEPYGVVCKCAACVNATPESDQFRKNWMTSVATNRYTILDMDTFANAQSIPSTVLNTLLELDRNTINEGLDGDKHYKFILLMIYVICEKMGRKTQAKLYRKRFDALNKIPEDSEER